MMFLFVIISAFFWKKGKYGKVFDTNGPKMSVVWTFRSRGSPQRKALGNKVAFPTITTVTPAVDTQ